MAAKMAMPGDQKSRPRIVVLTAPSGAGKTTIARKVLSELQQLRFSVSATTRRRRPNEGDGVDYYFLSEEDFREKIRAGQFVEYEEVYPGRFYGTLHSELESSEEQEPVLLDIDVKGATNVKQSFGEDAFAIFIAPPSIEALTERLAARGTETADSMRVRLDRAQRELMYANDFDALVVNDDLETAIDETLGLIRSFLGPAQI